MPAARRSNKRAIITPDAKKQVISLVANGSTVGDAMQAVDRKLETYKSWRQDDREFATRIDEVRAVRSKAINEGREELPPFPEFCEKYLRKPMAEHHLRMWDVLEDRDPRNFIDGVMRFDRGEPIEASQDSPDLPTGRIIINIPPGHAKTTVISEEYLTYLIHKDPNIRIAVICKDQELGKQIIGVIKWFLTSEIFAEMHAKFGPDGGWKDPDNSWSATRIYVQGKNDGEKDPTVQVLGVGGRIYGARLNVIILDDAITLANVNEYEKQRTWLGQEVESRLDGTGLLAILGTRVAPVDLYQVLRDQEVTWDDKPVYTYFSMPAVLDEGPSGNWEDWVPLWPERFPPRRLRTIRRREEGWALVYQQADVSENATFDGRAIRATLNQQRFPGPMTPGVPGHRQAGMSGLYVVAGLDPATTGHTAIIVTGIDRDKGKRYLLDGVNQRNAHAQNIIDHIQTLTTRYGIHEWVIERNAAQRFITQIPEIETWLRARGVLITQHYTNENKFDADFGIQAMAPLFLLSGTPVEGQPQAEWKKTPERAVIEFPATRQNPWVGELVNQLVVWQPSGMKTKQKTDLVMALWFTEIAARRILRIGSKLPNYRPSAWLTGKQKRGQRVRHLALEREQRAGA